MNGEVSTKAPQREWTSVLILSASQALSMTGSTLVLTVTALTGASLTDDAAMATLPLALQFVGTMAATIPASLLMGRVGRCQGFSIGQAIGCVFALISAYAVYQGDFWLFAVGSAGLGVHNAFWQYLRFAASEAVSPPKRARAISYVLAGGVVAALAGPWLATHSREILTPFLFAGSYVVLAGLSAATGMDYRPDPFRLTSFVIDGNDVGNDRDGSHRRVIDRRCGYDDLALGIAVCGHHGRDYPRFLADGTGRPPPGILHRSGNWNRLRAN